MTSRMKFHLLFEGHHVHYYIEGQGEPVIFLHGWPTNAKLWEAQVEALKSTHRVITFDWLGFGASDKPTNFNYTFTKSKEILDKVISKLLKEDEKVNIVAHDIGGPPAILWTSENESRVKRLILLNTVIYPFSTTLDKMSHTFFKVPLINDVLMSQLGLSMIMRSNTRSWKRSTRQSIKEILNAYLHDEKTIKLKTILEPLETAKENEFKFLSETYNKINTEKHFVIAKSDPLCYAHIKKLSEENPEVPRCEINKCGHYMPIDQPERLNEILIEILN